jgi:ribosomal protein S27AE
MDQERFEAVQQELRELMEATLAGIREWRTGHPAATFAEIEAAVEERLNRLRAKLLEEVARCSRVADLEGRAARERPPCPQCGGGLQLRGRQERKLTVPGNQQVHLWRSYATCSDCGAGLFPPG